MSNESFYNRNATRGYPLDGNASGVSDDGTVLPNGILIDGCLSFSEEYGQYAYVNALSVGPRFFSIVISAAESLTEPGVPIAVVTLAGLPTPELPYDVRALVPGAAGWLVFGQLAAVRFSGRFSSAQQSGLMRRTATPYSPLPVPYVAKHGTETQLIGDVGLYAGNDTKITRTQLRIAGIVRDVILIELADPGNTLAEYAGPCGARPESNTCVSPAVERIGDVEPDANGNLEIVVTGGGSLTSVPHGLLINSPFTVAGLCSQDVNVDHPPQDLCFEEFSEISEFSELPASESEAPSESEHSEFIEITYPLCTRFFTTQPAVLRLIGSWSQIANQALPAAMPCSDFGNPPSTFEVIRGSGSGHSTAVNEDPANTQLYNMCYSTAFRVVGGAGEGYAGLVWDQQVYPNGNRYFWFAAVDVNSGTLSLRRFLNINTGGTVFSAEGVPLMQNQWYRLMVCIHATPTPTRVLVTVVLSRITPTGDVRLATLYRISTPTPQVPGFGAITHRHIADFAYLNADLV